MMASPNYMKSEYEKMSYEELIEVKKQLIDSINAFENDDIDEDEWDICPGPDVQYQMNLEYLGVLALVIAEKYRTRTDDWFDDDGSEVCPGNPGHDD